MRLRKKVWPASGEGRLRANPVVDGEGDVTGNA